MKITLNDNEKKLLYREVVRHINNGNFKLSSGNYSSTYFDLKSLMFDNTVLYALTQILRENLSYTVSAIGGMEFGALPLICSMVYATSYECFCIRKQSKPHGLGGRVICERPERIKGDVILVDDVLTTGSTIDECVDVLNQEGFEVDVEYVFCIVDRSDNSYKRFPIRSIFNESDFQT